MNALPIEDVPVTLVTGELGIGKTTAILSAFAHRPANERWAVLVNEFGEVGLDGAVMEAGGLTVREVPGGCVCCSAGLALRVALVRLLREVRPDRLFIEPTGLAHPAAVLDTLTAPGLRDAVDLRATLALVDPARFLDPAVRARDLYADQVLAADVLVANRADRHGADVLARFRTEAAALHPPPLEIAVTQFGAIDPAWLALRPSPDRIVRGHAHDDGAYVTRGWVFPRTVVFNRDSVERAVQALVRPGPVLGAGVVRLKGLFRTPKVWLKVDATPDLLRWEGTPYRRDSRIELIVPSAPAPDWDAVEAALVAARWTSTRSDRA